MTWREDRKNHAHASMTGTRPEAMSRRNLSMRATSRSGVRRQSLALQSFLRLVTPGLAVLFCVVFQWSYVNWISPVWGYIGATYKSPDPTLLTVAYTLAVILWVLSPQTIRRPSQITYWFLYFTVYIPGMLVPLFLQYVTNYDLLLLELSLTGGMLSIALSYRLNLANIRRKPMSGGLFWTLFFTAFVLMNALMLIAFRGHMHFAGLKEVYDVRAEASQIQQQNASISYVSKLLTSVMNPFMIAYGLAANRRKLLALGIVGQVIVYLTAAMKGVLISPLLIIAIYYMARKHRVGWAPKLGLLVCAMFLALATLALGHGKGLAFAMATLTLFRTFAIPGIEIGQYQYFFEEFPHTFFSHVHGVNLLIASPYKLALGQEVGRFFEGIASNGRIPDSNVSFFAMDGIASLGLLGILIMGIVCALTFWVVDSSAKKYPIAFTASALTSCTMALANNSLFTCLLSGGIMLFIGLFIVLPRDILPNDGAG